MHVRPFVLGVGTLLQLGGGGCLVVRVVGSNYFQLGWRPESVIGYFIAAIDELILSLRVM